MSLNVAPEVAIALAVVGATQEKRKERRCWSKTFYLERRTFSHRNLLSVLDGGEVCNYLRMPQEVFLELLEMVAPSIEKQDTVMREAISPMERLMATLRYLATGRKLADMKFTTAISPQALSSIVAETCEAIFQCLKHYIKMPNTENEWKQVAATFEQKWNFNHCVGAIDGKHVAVKKPNQSGSTFFNYKKFFSVVLFACVDANYRFLYVHTGTNGSAGDSTIFQNTELYKKLYNGTLNLPPDHPLPYTDSSVPYVFLGDSAFSLNKHVLKPFPMKNITLEQRIFNYRLSRGRRVVEVCFGILAARFQVFQTTISLGLDTVDKIVLACCALHNFLATKSPSYLNDGSSLDNEDIENGAFREGEWRQHPMVPLSQTSVQRRNDQGNNVRNTFMNYFNNEGQVSFQETMLNIVRN